MYFDTIIKGGRVFSSEGSFRADVGIRGDKVMDLGRTLKSSKPANIIDATGKFIFPGAVDTHVHFQMLQGGVRTADDFENGSKAAACGGVTTFIDFAQQVPGYSLSSALDHRIFEAEDRACIDFGFHMVITDWKQRTRSEIEKIVSRGVVSFKVFTAYKEEGLQIDDGVLHNLLDETAGCGGTVMLHAENGDLIESLTEEMKKEASYRDLGAYALARARPAVAEAEAVSRAIKWAQVTGGHLHLAHISTMDAVQEIARAKNNGCIVTAETCPHYLLMTEEHLLRKNGHLFATCPPLRTKKDSQRLWKGLKEGTIDILCTDHCTFTRRQKDKWKGEFTKLRYGLPGVETLVPITYTEAVGGKRMTISKWVSLVSTNPAKLAGLYPRKGAILPGSDADLIIFDPRAKARISVKRLQTNVDWYPFARFKLKGAIEMVFSRGELVAENGRYVGPEGRGRFLKRKPRGK
ncbi:MAG: dihydropyrimidinase [Deltaproteobacteria bacterium]|nr:dihydropyrimidinase [Deltaproteobacteria bacterium]